MCPRPRPHLALTPIAVLDEYALDLVRRFVASAAGLAPLPYAAWTGFATALNGAIPGRIPDIHGDTTPRQPAAGGVRGAVWW